MITTALTKLLGVDCPIIQGGMAWVATAELAAAVSQAGGLGVIGVGNMSVDGFRKEVQKAKALTQRPFGVNVMLMAPQAEAVLQAAIELEVPVVTTGAGNPGPYVEKLKQHGIKVLPVVSSVALGKRLACLGVDALIAEGWEAGGHIGNISTLALVPQLVDAVDIPVVAAGGIADARGIVAAFALGAAGVQMGTRFICSSECTVHPAYKKAILQASDRDATVTGYSTGHPVRCLRNRFTRQYQELEQSGASVEMLNQFGAGRLAKAAREGDVLYGSVMAGQGAGLVKQILPVQAIMEELMGDVQMLIRQLGGFSWQN